MKDSTKLEPGKRRWHSRVAQWAILLFVFNVAAGICFRPKSDNGAHRNYSQPAWAYAAAWKEQYADEFVRSWAFQYEPFVGWRRRDFGGRYINTADGIRRGYRGKDATSLGAIKIFFLGSSTTWGTGVRDEYTIPSMVARLAEERGWAVEVTNYGESAYCSFQEAVLLSKLVAAGKIPDLVVFYDGVNDLFIQLDDGPSSVPIHDQLDRFRDIEKEDDPWRFLARYSFVHQAWRHFVEKQDVPVRVAPEVCATNVVKIRREALDLAFDLGRAVGFTVTSFHQPWMYTKKLLPKEQLPKVGNHDPGDLLPIVKAVDAATRADRRIVDITDALDDIREPIMLDSRHTNEIGTRVIAERMFKTLAPMIEQAVKAKRATAN